METFLIIVGAIFGILQIILFFKIWGMTDNVSKMVKQFEQVLDLLQKGASAQIPPQQSSQQYSDEPTQEPQQTTPVVDQQPAQEDNGSDVNVIWIIFAIVIIVMLIAFVLGVAFK